jgi:hypothetical protein
MDHRPTWYTADTDNAWDRVKAAFRNDWEQTKHDFGSKTAPDLGQDVDDTVKQAAGTEDAFENHEQAFRFGYGAQRQYRAQYPTWNNDLETRLKQDYGTTFDSDRNYIRRAYEYRPGTGTTLADQQRGENRP